MFCVGAGIIRGADVEGEFDLLCLKENYPV